MPKKGRLCLKCNVKKKKADFSTSQWAAGATGTCRGCTTVGRPSVVKKARHHAPNSGPLDAFMRRATPAQTPKGPKVTPPDSDGEQAEPSDDSDSEDEITDGEPPAKGEMPAELPTDPSAAEKEPELIESVAELPSESESVPEERVQGPEEGEQVVLSEDQPEPHDGWDGPEERVAALVAEGLEIDVSEGEEAVEPKKPMLPDWFRQKQKHWEVQHEKLKQKGVKRVLEETLLGAKKRKSQFRYAHVVWAEYGKLNDDGDMEKCEWTSKPSHLRCKACFLFNGQCPEKHYTVSLESWCPLSKQPAQQIQRHNGFFLLICCQR